MPVSWPPLGLRASTGRPTTASARYSSNVTAPSAGPYAAPTGSTPSVCPVIGTGFCPRWIEICASPAINAEPATAQATWNARRAVARERGGASVRAMVDNDDLLGSDRRFDLAGAVRVPHGAAGFSTGSRHTRYPRAMRIVAVPVKSLAEAKTRLAPALAPLERAALTLAMLEDVLDATTGVAGWQTWVISPDEAVLEIAARRGVRPMLEDKPPLSNAIRQVEQEAT